MLKPRKDPIGYLKDHLRAEYEIEDERVKTPKSTVIRPVSVEDAQSGKKKINPEMASIITPWELEKRRKTRKSIHGIPKNTNQGFVGAKI